MESVDGDVRLSVKLDTKTVQDSANELQKIFKSALSSVSNQSDFKTFSGIEETVKKMLSSMSEVAKVSTTFGNSFSATKVKVDTTNSTMLMLKNNVQKAKNEVDKLNSELSALEKQKIPTAEYQKLSKNYEVLAANADKIFNKMVNLKDEIRSLPAADRTPEMKQQLLELADQYKVANNQAEELRIQINKLKSEGKAFIFTDENSQKEFDKLTSNLQIAQNNFEIAKTKVEEFKKALDNIPTDKSITSESKTTDQSTWDKASEVEKSATLTKDVKLLQVLGEEYTTLSEKIKETITSTSGLNTTWEENTQVMKNAESEIANTSELLKNFLNLGDWTSNFENFSDFFTDNIQNITSSQAWDSSQVSDYVSNISGELAVAQNNLDSFATSENNAQAETTSFSEALGTASRIIGSFGSRVLSAVKSIFKFITSNKSAQRGVNDFNGVIKKGIGLILKYGLGIRSTYLLINKLRSAVKEGYKNLAGYSDEVNKSISSVLSSLAKLKNQLAATFQPIVNVVVPLLNRLIEKINNATVTVSKFFAALTGQNYVYKAADVQKQYVESLEDTAKAAEEAQEALENYLSPLDDINRYEEKTTSNKAINENKDIPDYSTMFDTVAIENKFKTLVDKIKKYFRDMFEPIENSWNKYGKTVIEKVKGTFNSLLATITSVRHSFETVWKNGTGESIVDNILQIFININNIITNISENFRKAWDSGIGLSIAQTLANTFNDILGYINNITEKTANWAKGINFQPILTAFDGLLKSLQGIINLAGDWTEKVWEKVFLPLASWAIEEAVPASLKTISGALELITAVGEKAGEILAFMWDNFFSKVAEWVGDRIVSFLETLGQFLKDVANNDKAVITLISIGTALLTIITTIKTLNAVLTLLSINPVTLFIGLVTAGIVALIVVIIEVITYWDTLKELFQKGSEMWKQGVEDLKKDFPVLGHFIEGFIGGIKNVFSGLIKFITGVFTGDWRKAWEGIKKIFKGIWDTFASIVKVPINAIIRMINSLISGIESKMNFVIDFLNAFGVDIPDWVPEIGGGHLGFNITRMNIPRIPYLAQGAVIPPNREFLAVLGDQKSGNNIEAPENLIRRIVREETANSGNNGTYIFPINIGGREITKVVIKDGKVMQAQTGRNPFELA